MSPKKKYGSSYATYSTDNLTSKYDSDDIDQQDVEVIWRKGEFYNYDFEKFAPELKSKMIEYKVVGKVEYNEAIDNIECDATDQGECNMAIPIDDVNVYGNVIFVTLFSFFWSLCGYVTFKRYSARYLNRPVGRRGRNNRNFPNRARLLAALKQMEQELDSAYEQYDNTKLYDVSVSVDMREKGTADGIIMTKKYRFQSINGRIVKNMKNIFVLRFKAINVVLESVEMVEKKPGTNIPKESNPQFPSTRPTSIAHPIVDQVKPNPTGGRRSSRRQP